MSAPAAAAGDEAKPTLASLVKRKLSAKDSGAARVGRWVHHVSEEQVNADLETYYCTFCGAHSLILDQLISELPKRSSDQARVVATARHEAQLLLDEGGCVKIKRTSNLVEKQYRYMCRGCGLPLAYVSYPFADTTSNKYLYLIDGAFSLTNTGKTKSQLEEEQRQKELEEPIIIPRFQVQKSNAAATTATSTTATPTTTAATSTTTSATADSSQASEPTPLQPTDAPSADSASNPPPAAVVAAAAPASSS